MIEGMDAVILTGDEAKEIMQYIEQLEGALPEAVGVNTSVRAVQGVLSEPGAAVSSLRQWVGRREQIRANAVQLEDKVRQLHKDDELHK